MGLFGAPTKKAGGSKFAAPSARQDNPQFKAPEKKAANPFFQDPTDGHDTPLFGSPSDQGQSSRFGLPDDTDRTPLFGTPSDPGPQARFGPPGDEEAGLTLDFSDGEGFDKEGLYTQDGIFVFSDDDWVEVVDEGDLQGSVREPLLEGSDSPFALISSWDFLWREESESDIGFPLEDTGELTLPDGPFNLSSLTVFTLSDNDPQRITFDWNFLTLDHLVPESEPDVTLLKKEPEAPMARDQAFVAFLSEDEESVVFQLLADANDVTPGEATSWQNGQAEVPLNVDDWLLPEELSDAGLGIASIAFGVLDVWDGQAPQLAIDNVTFENLDLMGLSDMPEPVL